MIFCSVNRFFIGILTIFTYMINLRRQIALAVVCLSTLPSCQHRELTYLTEIENTIQEKPEEALNSLRQIDPANLATNKEKGLYYLMLSMALDKNYIDIAADSLIQPAVNYYSRTTDKLHKFLSYYYLGRVHENAENYQQALSSFLLAESNVCNSVSAEYLSRLYARKGHTYYHQFAFDKAYDEANKYSIISRQLQDKRFYVRSMLDKVSYRLADRKNDEAERCLDSLETWMDNNGYVKDATFYQSRLPIFVELHPTDIDSIVALRNLYLDACDAEGMTPDYLMLANSYVKTKEPDIAYYNLMRSNPATQFNTFEHYAILAEILKAKGDFKGALDAVVKMDKALADINLSVFNNDVRFMEERHQFELQQIKSNNTRLHLILGILLLSAALIIAIFTFAKRRKSIKEELKKAREEYEFLIPFAKSMDNTSEHFSEAIRERLAALRPFAISKEKVLSPKHLKELNMVSSERHEFLISTGLLLAMTYPRYVSSLIKLGLTPEEIGLCALYLSGYSSKELNQSSYFGNIYRVNSGIRSKLGLPVNGEKIHSRLKEIFNTAENVSK